MIKAEVPRRPALLQKLNRRPSLTWATLSSLLVLISTWVAWQQASHPNAFRPEPRVSSSEFWLYPVERNAFKRLPIITEDLYSVFALDKDVWAVGGNSLIVHSGDGGATWERQTEAPQSKSQQSSLLGALGVVWAGELQINQSLASQPAPANQQASEPQNLTSPKRYKLERFGRDLTRVAFVDSRHGWAVGWNGTILATSSGGKSWQTQTSGTSDYLYGVCFHDNLHGWVVGENGTILATDNSGQSWHPQNSGTRKNIWSVNFIGNQYGWAAGDDGIILTTSNGGQSWQAQMSGSPESLTDIKFIDSLHGWAVGVSGLILSTDDGGRSWRRQPRSTANPFMNISFRDNQHGWVVGFSGAILATNNGGESWHDLSITRSANLFGISFSDVLHGWAVGEKGNILATVDGGQSWQIQSNSSSNNLQNISFSRNREGEFDADIGIISNIRDIGQNRQTLIYQRYPAPWFYPLLFVALVGYWQAFRSLLNEQKLSKAAPVPRKLGNRIITDQPAGPGSADLLGARQIALGLTRFLTNENTQPPLTIAITGEWGSGKSSVMNYLFANLKREGLSPVWFNAWHHRDEQNVLASILANVHRQAIKAWWQPQGFWFRLRMLWRRHWLLKTVLLASLFASMFLFGWLSQTPGKWQEAMHYALYLAKIEQPVILSDRSVKQLCPSLSSSQENTKAGSTEKAKDWFTAEQCKDLQGLVGDTSSSRNDLRCAEGIAEFDTNRCFATPDVLLAALEKRLDLKLSTEDEATILKTVEHLHPDSPVPVPFESWVKWVSALLGVLAIFVVKGMTVVGLAPNQLVQTVFKQAGITMQNSEKVGTRLWCESHFKIITQLLGRRRLVLFIDDLDRCDRDFTRQLLEASNFLSNAGRLFMVMGMAPRYVLANVTLSFEETAEAVDEVDKLNDDQHPGHDPTVGQSWFARHYLQKLIHIEVPVPKPETAQVLALLTSDGKTSETDNKLLKAEQLERQIDLAQLWFWKICRILAVVSAIGGGYYLGTHPLSSESVTTETSEQPKAPEAAPTTGDTSPQPITEAPKPTPKSDDKPRDEAFQPGFDDRNIENWPIWTSLGLLLLLLAGGFGLSKWLQRPPKWLDTPWLAWLQPLWKRTKVAMLGPESGQDTKDFVDALEIWHGLIAAKNPTPRTLKAFVNRLRYFASRDTGQAGNGREAQLVALAAIYYVYPEEFESIIGLMQLYFADPKRPSKLGFENHWPGVAMLAGQHEHAFGSIPSQQDIDFFHALNEDICIHRPD